MFKYGVLSGPYFPAIGLNTESYCGIIRTRKNSVFGPNHAVLTMSVIKVEIKKIVKYKNIYPKTKFNAEMFIQKLIFYIWNY